MNSTLKPTVSPLQLRDELEAMVLKELLGPGSAEEEIIESPGTRYLVGVLAPRKRARVALLLSLPSCHRRPQKMRKTRRRAKSWMAKLWPSVA